MEIYEDERISNWEQEEKILHGEVKCCNGEEINFKYDPDSPIIAKSVDGQDGVYKLTDVGAKMLKGQGVMEKTDFGAKRESNTGRGRFDLLPYEAIEALAKWYEAGAQKYDERNWEQGISVKDCINRMIRHAMKTGNGWTDEDHLAAVMWNAAAAITMIQRKPECNDHVWTTQEEEIPTLFTNESQIPMDDDTCIKDPELKKQIIRLSDADNEFLDIALKSGGLSDAETLIDWLNRRI